MRRADRQANVVADAEKKGEPPVTITETRYALLARLAWELRAAGTTTHLTLPASGEPMLWVVEGPDRRDAVVATQYLNRWVLLWRGTELDADHLPRMAQAIVAAVSA
ncbi:hypothetical protein ACRYCC_28840 [Actinomadura scrupuli]|uniref:hypothetical protein n=1 Tax=Actinomadura scrupuli TaxID=559629 RepID=UPI003D952FB0